MSDPKIPLRFPKHFLWGAATSAHQVEGGNHNQWSVWELENAKSLAKQAQYRLNELPSWPEIKHQAMDPANYISGQADNHYALYRADFAALSAMNMNAYRFSIEWSRIEPEEGQWNQEAVEHYRDYITALKERGIEPMVTLMHWTLPVWFDRLGGFEKRRNVRYFVRFAEKIFAEYGRDVRYFCTLNEPEIYTEHGWVDAAWPPAKMRKLTALVVYLNLAYAHRQVYRLARKTSRRLKIGLSKDVAHHAAADDKITTRLNIFFNIYVIDYFFLNRVRRQLDWLGVNYYFSNRYQGFRRIATDAPLNDLGWEMRPQDLQFVLERLSRRYKKPIIVTESGVADQHDRYRKWWISQSLTAIDKALRRGVRVEGYLHWSLLDNFEWAYGRWPHFGLLQVDYATLKRTPRTSAIWFGKIIKQLRGL